MKTAFHPIIANLHFYTSNDGRRFFEKKHPVRIWGKNSDTVLEQITKLGLQLDGSEKSRYPGHALSFVTFSLPDGVSEGAGNRTKAPITLENGRVYFGKIEENIGQNIEAPGKKCDEYDESVVVDRAGYPFPLCCCSDVVVGVYDQSEPALHGKVIREGNGNYPYNVQLRFYELARQRRRDYQQQARP